MTTVALKLTQLVRDAAEAMGHGDAPVPLEPCVPTQDARHGDYQSNFAFRLGKALRTNPREVATKMVEAMGDSPLLAGAPEVAGPGFINFRLNADWAGGELARRTASPRFGTPQVGADRVVVIDYSSPNVAKRMHIGHLRSTVIGDALHRLSEYVGYDVVADNHIGDWGTPFGKLIVAWERERKDEAFSADPVGELQRLYVWFGEAAADDPALLDEARAHTARLQQGDPETQALWRLFVDASMQEFDGVYARLGVEFDEVLGESAYHPMLQGATDRLLAQGLAEQDDGAVISRFSADDGKGLKDKVLVIQKRDGAFTYGASDVACVDYRVERWQPAKVLYVVGMPQKQHFQQVFCLAKKQGHTETELLHIGFGLLRFADGTKASSRSGGALNLVDVLDEAVRRARAVVDAREDDLAEEEKQSIAEAVGLGAVKYADLSQNPASDIIFDWDKALAFQGNTAPYLMYAHARCCAILRRAGSPTGSSINPIPAAPEERDLVIGLLRFPELVLAAASTHRPNLLAEYLYRVASSFSTFYLACPVLKDGVSDGDRQRRLAMVEATRLVLHDGLGLLGLGAPERM